MSREFLGVKLVVQGPIMTQDSNPGELGVDALMARDHLGRYCLPGSLVKGELRKSWCELGSVDAAQFGPAVINGLLGEESANLESPDGSVEPVRSRMVFSDFSCSHSPGPADTIYRVRIDADTGAAVRGAFQAVEAPFAPGRKVCFEGEISFLPRDSEEKEKVRQMVVAGLNWIVGLGAYRGIGFGRLLKVVVKPGGPEQQRRSQSSRAFREADRLHLVLEPQSPFCLSRPRVKANVFESEEVISGAAIKGALSNAWRDPSLASRYRELQGEFHKLTVRAAFPAPQEKVDRPRLPPLSLVKVSVSGRREKPTLYDVSLLKKPCLLSPDEGKSPNWRAPLFRVDWKETADVDRLYGWGSPPRLLRVRNAMDHSRRSAADEQLFAYRMVVPGSCRWHSQVELSELSTDARKQFLELIEKGLYGLGKTKTRVKVTLKTVQPQELPAPISPDQGASGPTWVVVLQTPALLADPNELSETSGRLELLAEYRRVFDELSEKSLSLQRFYASQSLAGGFYLYRRFVGSSQPYYPFLLTDAGSVFVFESLEETRAEDMLKAWLGKGLPLPQWARQRFGRKVSDEDMWQHCPYLPENGFGEVVVNDPRHKELKPKDKNIYDLGAAYDF